MSIGVQAFQDEILQKWNRSHVASQSLDCIKLAQAKGFENISIDLIYGDPLLSHEEWATNIQQVIDLEVPHISSYALTVEPKTALAHHIQTGQTQPPDDEKAGEQYATLQKLLADNGYIQYEVSNFAKPGFESRHNKSYWSGKNYLGLGPSAHSYNLESRQWNVANNPTYIKSLTEDRIPFEIEHLTPVQRYNELVMTGLRNTEGISLSTLAAIGPEFEKYFLKTVQRYLDAGTIRQRDTSIYFLTPSQYFFADGLASALFYEEK